jgi:hypothetical protein
LTQGAGVPNEPAAVHVCTPLLVVEHCIAPGTQLPEHAPFEHTKGHALALLIHAPFPSHVWTVPWVLPLH